MYSLGAKEQGYWGQLSHHQQCTSTGLVQPGGTLQVNLPAAGCSDQSDGIRTTTSRENIVIPQSVPSGRLAAAKPPAQQRMPMKRSI